MEERYVHITWKSAAGGWRRSFAAAPVANGKHLVTYHLVERDTDGKNESVIAFAQDSSVRVRPARLNTTYCELEVVTE
jgi:hypothetical protein